MPYIGKTPTVGNFQVCDAISVVNGQAAYTLQVGGVNVAPESANHMLVSLNGILQKPGSSFTISGSTITFASNLATGDVIDFVHILGNVLDFGAPSDDSVTAAKLNTASITGQTAETTVADDDTVLIHDTSASALRKMTVSNLTANAGVAGISSSADATAITIDSSEQVGIGATSPGALLELKHGTNVRMLFDDTVDSQCTIRSIQDTAGHNGMRLEADNIAFRTASGTSTGVERLRLTNQGSMLMGTTSTQASTPNLYIHAAGAMLFLQRKTSNGHIASFINTSGSVNGRIDIDGSNTTYATSSDHRLKENVDYTWDATTRLKQLRPARFNWISDDTNTLQDGFIAHEVSSVVPKAVIGTHNEVDADGNPVYQSIDHSMLVPLLVKTIQELEARITTLENA